MMKGSESESWMADPPIKGGKDPERCSVTKLRNQKLELREARICRKEYQKRCNCTEKDLQGDL